MMASATDEPSFLLRLHPALRGVHANGAVLEIEPHRRHLRRAVRHGGGEIGERLLLLHEVEIFVGDRGHGFVLLTLIVQLITG
jgi:hypothetical protein